MTNSAYYVDNPANDVLCQNGYTVKLTAESEVECGETYHIRLAIADGSDTALESIVVLESGSFESNSVVEVDLNINVGADLVTDNPVIFEDCGEAVLTFTRPIETIIDIEEMVIIDYSASTATNGVDFTELPDTVFFPPFVTVQEFPLDAFEDGLVEGTETVVMEILNLAACNGGGLTSYFEFDILDEPEPLVVDGWDTGSASGFRSARAGRVGWLWQLHVRLGLQPRTRHQPDQLHPGCGRGVRMHSGRQRHLGMAMTCSTSW